MFGVASTSDVLILLMLVLCLYHCTVCTGPVLLVRCSGMANTSNVPTYSRLYLYCTCTVAQCVLCLYPLYSDSAWPARAMYVCTVLVPLVQWSGVASTGNVHLARFCSYCACTIAQCVLCVYPLYSGLPWPARTVYLLARVLTQTIAQCVLCLCLMYSGLAWPARVVYI